MMLSRTWIIVGDIHLYAGADPRVADDLTQLVTNVSRERPDAAVIFNGDTFDLDRVHSEPKEGVGEARAAARVRSIARAFPALFQAMQRHAQGGGRLVFIAGNHDAELLLDTVRDELLRWVGSPGACSVVSHCEVGDRIIEHGHQVDPDAAFHPDPATALSKMRLSAFPLASLITRILLSHIPRFRLGQDHYRAPYEVLLRVLRDYRLHAVAMIVRFPIAGLRIVWHSVLARRRGDVDPLGNSTMRSPWQVARRLYLDRYVAAVLAISLVVLLAAGAAPRWVSWPLAVVTVGLVVPVRRRAGYAGRDMARCAQVACNHVEGGARLVVHGHTHRAFAESLEGGAQYMNHGAFSTLELGGVGPCRTYLQVEPDGRGVLKRLVCGLGPA